MDKDEEKAALVIQKHARGRKTRQSFRKARRLVLFMFRPPLGAHVDKSVSKAVSKSPKGANCYERTRDRTLGLMCRFNTLFGILAIAPPPDVAEIKAKTPRDGTVVDNLEAAAGVAAPAPAPCQA